MKKLFIITVLFLSFFTVQAQDDEYTDGVFILNEDWYGHQNSTINFFSNKNEIVYRVFQYVNYDEELGCTAQYGTIYKDHLIIMAKQDREPSSQANGGRVTLADYPSIDLITQHACLARNANGKSMADGRGCVGVDENTVYLGSTNGIYPLDLESQEISPMIEGTKNKLITGNEVNTDGNGPLYRNQIGIMIRGTDYVFAIYQDRGILVIDPGTHTIVDSIPGCFATMVLSKDGFIWAAENTQEGFKEYPYGLNGDKWLGNRLKKINQHSLEFTDIDIPDEYRINQSWYAWTAGVLCASKQQNVLYWVEHGGWFTGGQTTKIYKYDIATGAISLFFDFLNENKDYAIYCGQGIGVNPIDDMMYVAVQEGEISSNKFFIYRLKPDGTVSQKFELKKNHWYPAMLISPDVHEPEVTADFPTNVIINSNQPVCKIYLGDKVIDKDNFNGSIVKTVEEISDETLIAAKIVSDTLSISSSQGNFGDATLTLKINSNGKLITKEIQVLAENPTPSALLQLENNLENLILTPNPTINYFTLNFSGKLEVFASTGAKVKEISNYEKGQNVDVSTLLKGVYFVRITTKDGSNTKRFIKM